MRRPTAECCDLASRLLACEAEERQEPAELVDAGERICRKLHEQLAIYLGAEGFRVLVARSLRLAKAEFPFLERVEAGGQSETCLKGLAKGAQGLDSTEVRRGIVAWLANFIWLLEVFIGEEITLRSLARIWPDVVRMAGAVGDER